MSDPEKPTEMEKDTIYVFESAEDRFLRLDTNKEYEIIEIGKAFMVDSHMHIESLNCTPLQLQWATTFLNTGLTMPSDRKGLTDFLNNWAIKQFAMKDFGVIGQYYTDSIGKMYMGRMERNSTRIALDWMAKKDTEKEKEKKQNELQGTHDETTEKKTESLSDFFRCPSVSKYYTYFKPFHMNIAHPMDLCYAHFWGVHRIPMYLKVPGEDQFYFIDDYRKITSVVTGGGGMGGYSSFEGYQCVYDFDPLKQGWFEQGGVYKREHHLLYDFPLEDEFNKFQLYYQTGNRNADHIVGFDLDRIEGVVKDKELSEATRAEQLNGIFTDLAKHYPVNEMGKVYHHFLEKVPLD